MGQPLHQHFSYFLNVPVTSDSILSLIALSVLIAIGTVAVLFGLRLFRLCVCLIGIAVGFLVTTTIISEYSSDVRVIYIPGLVAGLIVGLFCTAAIKLGILMLGAVVGFVYAFLGYIGFLHYISTWHYVVLYAATGIFGLIGVVVAFVAEKELIIVATSYIGALLVVRSIDLLVDNTLTLQGLGRKEDLSHEGWGFWVFSLVLGAIGVLFQVVNPLTGSYTHHYCSSHHRQHCPNCHTYHHIRQSCPYVPRPEQMVMP